MAGIVGVILAFLMLINGFAALRRSLDELVKYDPFGKRILERRGEAFTLRLYRLYGAGLVVLGLVLAYLSVQLLME